MYNINISSSTDSQVSSLNAAGAFVLMNKDEFLNANFLQIWFFFSCHFQVILELHNTKKLKSFGLRATFFPLVWRTLKLKVRVGCKLPDANKAWLWISMFPIILMQVLFLLIVYILKYSFQLNNVWSITASVCCPLMLCTVITFQHSDKVWSHCTKRLN